MGLGRLCSSHCCNVHVLQISPCSEKNSNASCLTEDTRCCSCYAEFSISLVLAPPFFLSAGLHFFRRLQSLNSLIELKSASQITAQAGDRLMAPRLPDREKRPALIHFSDAILFCNWHAAGSQLTHVFALSSEKAVEWNVQSGGRLMRVYSHCSTNAAAKLIITWIFHVGGKHSFGVVRVSVGVQERSNSKRRWSGERLSALARRHFHSFLRPQQQKKTKNLMVYLFILGNSSSNCFFSIINDAVCAKILTFQWGQKVSLFRSVPHKGKMSSRYLPTDYLRWLECVFGSSILLNNRYRWKGEKKEAVQDPTEIVHQSHDVSYHLIPPITYFYALLLRKG